MCFGWEGRRRRDSHPAGRVTLLFFFQAEDGIRDVRVTGVQTCALPILRIPLLGLFASIISAHARSLDTPTTNNPNKGILMSSSSTAIPQGPGSVSQAPNLPDGFTDTFTSQYVDTRWLPPPAFGTDGTLRP